MMELDLKNEIFVIFFLIIIKFCVMVIFFLSGYNKILCCNVLLNHYNDLPSNLYFCMTKPGRNKNDYLIPNLYE